MIPRSPQASAPRPLQRLLGGLSWMLAGSLLARGGSFLAMVLAARLLSQEDFGRLGAVQNTTGMFGVLAGFGLGLTATTWIARLQVQDPQRAGRLAGALLSAGCWSSVALAAALACSAAWLAPAAFADDALVGPLAFGAILVPLSVLFGIQGGILVGCEEFAALARCNMAVGLVAVLAMAAGAWLGGLTGAVFGLAAPLAAGCLWARFELRRCLSRAGLICDHRRWWDNWRLLLGFSLPVALASVMVVPVNWFTQSWLARSGGMEEVAHFTAGNQWRMLLIFVPMQLVSASLPSLAAAHARGDRIGFGRTTFTSLAIAAGPTAALVAFMAMFPAVLLGFYGPSYQTASAALVLLAWSAVPMAANIVFAAALNGAGAAWRNAFASLCYGIASLAFLAVVPHTAAGLAWSQLYACGVSTLVYVTLLFILRPRFPDEGALGTAAPARTRRLFA